MNGNRDKETAQRGSNKIAGGLRIDNKHKQEELYRIPSDLVDAILGVVAISFS